MTPNNIEFCGERKRARCTEGLGNPCEEVAAPTGMFGPFVRFAFHGLRYDETGCLERGDDLAGK